VYLKSLQLLQTARTLAISAQQAGDERQWNVAARHAYDSMELAIKAVWLLVGQLYPRRHNPGLPRGNFASRIPLVAWQADVDPMEGSVLIIRESQKAVDSADVLRMLRGTYTMLGTANAASVGDISLIVDGSSLYVLDGANRIYSITDPVSSSARRQHWVQLALESERWSAIERSLKAVPKGREESLYFERRIGQEEARRLVNEACGIYTDVKRHAGYDLTGLSVE